MLRPPRTVPSSRLVGDLANRVTRARGAFAIAQHRVELVGIAVVADEIIAMISTSVGTAKASRNAFGSKPLIWWAARPSACACSTSAIAAAPAS
ncbi:hypothetical protein [Burkholderia gladioli]|uniref:hypothetical protein n=1 Tax=Burkholderia gladioli TaxID=28095 RepID=UPI003D1B223C